MEVITELALAVGNSFDSVQVDLPAVAGKLYKIEDYAVISRGANTTATIDQFLVAISSRCDRTQLLLSAGDPLAADILGVGVLAAAQYQMDQLGHPDAANTLVSDAVFYSSVLLIAASGHAGVVAGGAINTVIRLKLSQVTATPALLQLLQARNSGCS